MLILYWQIGEIIIEQRKTKKWGSKVIDHLAKDLKTEFGTISGFSNRNLKYMAYFPPYFKCSWIEYSTPFTSIDLSMERYTSAFALSVE